MAQAQSDSSPVLTERTTLLKTVDQLTEERVSSIISNLQNLNSCLSQLIDLLEQKGSKDSTSLRQEINTRRIEGRNLFRDSESLFQRISKQHPTALNDFLQLKSNFMEVFNHTNFPVLENSDLNLTTSIPQPLNFSIEDLQNIKKGLEQVIEDLELNKRKSPTETSENFEGEKTAELKNPKLVTFMKYSAYIAIPPLMGVVGGVLGGVPGAYLGFKGGMLITGTVIGTGAGIVVSKTLKKKWDHDSTKNKLLTKADAEFERGEM